MNASALTSRIRRSLGLAALSLATCVALVGHTAPAQAQTRIKMVLNWKYQGPQAWFFIAQDRGYFKAEGLDVTIDIGSSSVEGINRVASGAYEVGFADVNSLVKFRDDPRNLPVKAVMMVSVRMKAVMTQAIWSVVALKLPLPVFLP